MCRLRVSFCLFIYVCIAFTWTFVCVRGLHTRLFVILGTVRVCTGVFAYRFTRLMRWIRVLFHRSCQSP
jgi:hypothetical protein